MIQFPLTEAHNIIALDSAQAYIDYATDTECESALTEAGAHTGDFFHFKSFEEACDAANTGWPEGREKIDALTAKLLSQLEDKLETYRPKLRLDVAGKSPVVALHLQGRPDCMRRRKKVKAVMPVFRILTNVNFTANIGQGRIFNRGAATLALCEALKRLGVETIVDGVNYAKGYGKLAGSPNFGFTFPIKVANAGLDMDRMAFLLCNRDSNRRIGFGARCNRPDAKALKVFQSGGNCASTNVPTADQAPYDLYMATLSLSSGSEFETPEDTLDYVVEQISRVMDVRRAA